MYKAAVIALLAILAAPVLSNVLAQAKAEVQLSRVQTHAQCVVETRAAQEAAGQYTDTRACR